MRFVYRHELVLTPNQAMLLGKILIDKEDNLNLDSAVLEFLARMLKKKTKIVFFWKFKKKTKIGYRNFW